MSRTYVSGIELRDVDDGSFAVTVRIQSSIGNYLSVTGAGAETLARARNPFERGDGVMDAGVMDFTAMPADAARMLAALEYTHAVDDKYDGDGSAVDEISVSVMSGACVRKDALGLTGCPRAADVSSESTAAYLDTRVGAGEGPRDAINARVGTRILVAAPGDRLGDGARRLGRRGGVVGVRVGVGERGDHVQRNVRG